MFRASEMIPKRGPGLGRVLSLKNALSWASTACFSSLSASSASRIVNLFARPDGLPEHPERAVADRVERPPPEPPRLDARQLLDAVEHLPRGLVREREEEDLARAHALREEPGDPVGQRAGLAGAGPREDEERAGLGGHRRELLVVQLRPEVDLGDRVGRGLALKYEIHGARRAYAGLRTSGAERASGPMRETTARTTATTPTNHPIALE